jgi:hypothetical protein
LAEVEAMPADFLLKESVVESAMWLIAKRLELGARR